jgi:lysophospholipase L1-like esterase
VKLLAFLRTTAIGIACLPGLALPAESPASRWQAEFAAFSQADAQHPPERGGAVFVGSSSIRLWDGLETEFDRFPTVLKRGFGGSTMTDCADNVQRLVLAYEPRLVVLYAGENDLSAGSSPDDVLKSVQKFADAVRRAHPSAPIAYVSIKPSPLRTSLLPVIRDTNERIRSYLASLPNAQFIDVHTAMLDAQGSPRPELYRDDRLHLNAAGYALWRREISARLP